MIIDKYKKRKDLGITLIEILMASFVFSLIIMIVSGIFITNYGIQRKTYAVQTVLAESSYSIEYMSRLLRMARKDIKGICSNGVFKNHTYIHYIDGSNRGITFLDYKGNCVSFYYDSVEKSIKVDKRNVNVNEIFINHARITSDLVSISNFKIYLRVEPVTGTPGPNDDLFMKQPSVTISFNIKDEIQKGEENPFNMSIQTTVTRRGLDVR